MDEERTPRSGRRRQIGRALATALRLTWHERHGYLPCATRMEHVPIVELQGDAGMRPEPSEAAPVLVTYGVGVRLWLLGMVVQEGRTWLTVQDGEGHSGFLPEGT